jgi:hypothetical protein
MPVPARIREEARLADEQLRVLVNKAVAGPNAAPIEPEAPAGDPPAPSLDNLAPSDTPHPNAVPSTPPPSSGEPIDSAKYAELLQKHETLQGLSNKDRAKLAEAEQRLAMLERLMAAQAAARAAEPTAAAPAPAPAPTTPTSLVTPDEVTEFGADLIDVVRRVAREEYGSKIESILSELQRLNTRVIGMSNTLQSTSSVVHEDAEAKFVNALNSMVVDSAGNPDWEALNLSTDTSPGSFLDWVNQMGNDSDVPRIEVLQRAYQRKDAKKCAAIFNAYKAEKGLANGPAPAPANAAMPDPAASLVSPSPVAPASPTSQRGAAKKWTLSEIEKVYSDFTKGKYKGEAKMAEYKRLTADIERATVEGRVTS